MGRITKDDRCLTMSLWT